MTSTTLVRMLAFTLFAFIVHVEASGHLPGLATSQRRHGSLARNARSVTRRCSPRSGRKAQKANTVDKADDSVKVNTGGQQNLIQVSGGSCGDSGATKETTATSGPNGRLDWLNCGVDKDGWKPPFVTVDQVKAVSLSDAMKDSNSPFHACQKYTDKFEKYAGEFSVPAIVLASFAMQESSCKEDTVGGAGEQGLMQLTNDKCGQAPRGNCRDPDYNIKTGAKFFKDSLDSNGGDFLKTVGQYNGWTPGMTINSATAAANGGNCRAQNNLDYLHQFTNGWMQNINVYGSTRYGKYFNLDKCH